MSYKESGIIKTVGDVESGTSQAGKEWKKITFTIVNNGGYEGREQLFAFEIFGAEKVDNFLKYNKVSDAVDVDFNISTNEWKGKYFTSLGAWKVFKQGVNTQQPQPQPEQVVEGDDDLPF